jgi:hypothetical protein
MQTQRIVLILNSIFCYYLRPGFGIFKNKKKLIIIYFSREEATATARRPEITEQHLCGDRNICLATGFSDVQNKYNIYSP